MSDTSPQAEETLAKLERFALLVEDYLHARQYRTKEKIATPEEMNDLASQLAVAAARVGLSYGPRPFSDVAVSWWRCTEIELRPAIEELRALLTAKAECERLHQTTPMKPSHEPVPAMRDIRTDEELEAAMRDGENREKLLAVVEKYGSASSQEDLLDKLSREGVVMSPSTAKSGLAELKRNGTLVACNEKNGYGYKLPS